MRENLSTSLDLVFGDEGGYSNASSDKGGPTKYGITHSTLAAYRGVKSVTAEQVKAMTKAEAEEIYRKSYWTQAGGELLPSGIDYMAFDFGVNSGPGRAVKILQTLVGVEADGIVGVKTADAAKNYGPGRMALIDAYGAARMDFLRSLTNPKTGFPVNGRGWTIRVTGIDPKGVYAAKPGVIGNAKRMAAGTTTEPAASSDGGAKAVGADKGVIEILKKPEAWGPLTGLLGAAGSLFAGSGPVQWALAAAIIAGIGAGLVVLVKRVRAD